jgi:DNA mismatch repair protein MutS2
MKFFPESALVQLEFEKVKDLLALHCRTGYAKTKAGGLRIHTKKEFIQTELQQSNEFKSITQTGLYFPNDFILNFWAYPALF